MFELPWLWSLLPCPYPLLFTSCPPQQKVTASRFKITWIQGLSESQSKKKSQ